MVEKIFPVDVFSKRERVERVLNFQPVDRAALHDQLSYNPGVITLYTGKQAEGFNYTASEVGQVIRRTLDACFIPVSPSGVGSRTDADGFTYYDDQWNTSLIGRPFADLNGARDYLQRKTAELRSQPLDAAFEREQYRVYMAGIQAMIGETVHIDFSIGTGFCECWSNLGLELFSYLYAEEPQVIRDYLDARVESAVRKVDAVGDPLLSPVVLIAEDFASKSGSIFSPRLLRDLHFPSLRRLTRAWHERGLKVLYHSDGNWRSLVGEMADCEVDGFYCLEPALGMDIVALRAEWPGLVWAGGVDGVDLMERGTPEAVRAEVRRQVLETGVFQHGGIFIGSSSEINPPVKPENFMAMVDTVGELRNPEMI